MVHEDTEARISGHYGWSGILESIEQELRRNGIEPRHVTVAQLAPIDNYHWHRLAGTLALARAAAITSADRVLDVGGGLGGPARVLATRLGCRVTVLDLTPEYCTVGETLTSWTGLTDRVSFVRGNALALPFADGSFDVVWTQHASMNIPDKARLYGEVARVVRRGGALRAVRCPRRSHAAPSFPRAVGERPILQLPAVARGRPSAHHAGRLPRAELDDGPGPGVDSRTRDA